MSIYDRAVRGAEAGVIAAGAVELSFFVMDLVRLTPLATPLTISGVVPGPGGVMVDLSDLSGVLAVLWAVYQIVLLTFVHLLAFGVIGVAASLLFDWTAPGGFGRMVAVAALCVGAFYVTVAWSGSVGVLGSLGVGVILGMNLLGAAVLGGSLRLVAKLGAEAAEAA